MSLKPIMRFNNQAVPRDKKQSGQRKVEDPFMVQDVVTDTVSHVSRQWSLVYGGYLSQPPDLHPHNISVISWLWPRSALLPGSAWLRAVSPLLICSNLLQTYQLPNTARARAKITATLDMGCSKWSGPRIFLFHCSFLMQAKIMSVCEVWVWPPLPSNTHLAIMSWLTVTNF